MAFYYNVILNSVRKIKRKFKMYSSGFLIFIGLIKK